MLMVLMLRYDEHEWRDMMWWNYMMLLRNVMRCYELMIWMIMQALQHPPLYLDTSLAPQPENGVVSNPRRNRPPRAESSGGTLPWGGLRPRPPHCPNTSNDFWGAEKESNGGSSNSKLPARWGNAMRDSQTSLSSDWHSIFQLREGDGPGLNINPNCEQSGM